MSFNLGKYVKKNRSKKDTFQRLLVNDLGWQRKDGHVGIEIECEPVDGTNLLSIDTKNWTTVPEGSLRGGLEYISKGPIRIKEVSNALDEWSKASAGLKFKNSLRTSVHLHFNAQDWTYEEVYKLIGCFWLFENLLVSLNGKERIGNLFCLRSSDSEDFVYEVLGGLKNGKYLQSFFGKDFYRYSALNLESLAKYGSIEFRFLKGSTDTEWISMWIRALYAFVQYSRRVDFRELTMSLGKGGGDKVTGILTAFFPQEFVKEIIKEVTLYDIHRNIMEGYCYSYRLMKDLEDTQVFKKLHELPFDEDEVEEEETKKKNLAQGNLDYNPYPYDQLFNPQDDIGEEAEDVTLDDNF